ncbi:MAG TPA: protein-glutamate O-methyltransferase CheR [Gemmataceae bacterium]|nr:protein-glutamate O-methyltransferase CheR [Gemmataceae bacterium]
MSLSQVSFDFVRAVLRERSAHSLEADKLYLVETRLLGVARQHGFKSVEDLVLHLHSRQEEKLLTEIVEAMTINETSFFRDENAFEGLRQYVLAELVRQRSRLRCLHIWSASCSSGQEPFSIAMLLCRHFPALSGWNIRILASDLSKAMLARARRGVYSDLEMSRGLSAELRETYFQKKEDGWQIGDDLLRMVVFQQINLSGVWPELPPLDLVLLRNVLIYFDTPTKRQILDKVCRVIQPDGYLMLGGAESTYNLDDRFLPVSFQNVSFFRRT